LKQGEKISNLENASRNLIYIPLTICKKIFKKDFTKEFAKTKQVMQIWSKMLNKTNHAYLVEVKYWFKSKQPMHLPYTN
jgi:hypothetical protein